MSERGAADAREARPGDRPLGLCDRGLAAYVAHLPGANAVDVLAVKETIRGLAPDPLYRGLVPPLVVEADAMIDKIEAAPEAIARARPGGS
jgi:hypothetical protein